MDEKKVKTWRLVLLLIAVVSMILFVVMHALPFTKVKLTGEDVYTGFELIFGKTVSSPFGDIELVTPSIDGVLFNIFFPIVILVNILLSFKKKTKRVQGFLKGSFVLTLLLGIYTYVFVAYGDKKYTNLSIKLEAMDFARGAIFAILFCGIATICLFLTTFVFKEKKEEKKTEEKE